MPTLIMSEAGMRGDITNAALIVPEAGMRALTISALIVLEAGMRDLTMSEISPYQLLSFWRQS
jgi:hypothetical protein